VEPAMLPPFGRVPDPTARGNYRIFGDKAAWRTSVNKPLTSR
jgi:hypothetical protein